MTRTLFSLALASTAAAILTGSAATPAAAVQNRIPYCDCIAPATHRQADPDDYACVTPASRQMIIQENAEASQHRVSDADNTCLSGYVWRDAFDGDGVCVVPSARDRVHWENAHWGAEVDGLNSGNSICRYGPQ